MASTTGPESGYLVLADISGFTAFVTATELEHGAEVTGTLLADVMAALAPPLEIQELEGDAVFALGPDAGEADHPILDAVGRAFGAFRRRQREIGQDTSCACRACRGVLGLSLKVIVHHGRFLRQVVRDRSRVAGPDIILAHRFLKNDVERSTYVLFTEAALARLGIDPAAHGLDRYTGRYAHFGEVTCFVASLDPAPYHGEDPGEIARGLRSRLGSPVPGADRDPSGARRPVIAA
jgi:hypothetical protein